MYPRDLIAYWADGFDWRAAEERLNRLQKLRAWSDRRPGGTSLIDRDAMLTDVTIYWLTGTIGSSMRMYRAIEAMPTRSSPGSSRCPLRDVYPR
ncbi:MAG: epoxide hydrolase N-terminal domain-containing protein [Solirubrobacteraceae bacterium]